MFLMPELLRVTAVYLARQNSLMVDDLVASCEVLAVRILIFALGSW